MTVGEIINQVRWCVDEENGVVESSLADYEDTYFDNIVKAKIGASLRWCALYADASLLSGGSSDASGIVKDYTYTVTDSTEEDAVSTLSDEGGSTDADATDEDETAETSTADAISVDDNGRYILPVNVVRVVRVRNSTWKKGVSHFIEEDSDEYLMQSDDTSMATEDRPVVALLQMNPLRVELFPTPKADDVIEISVINAPSADADYSDSDTEVSIPNKVCDAFVYHLAYLVMCSHGDYSKATAMLGVAKELIGVTQNA